MTESQNTAPNETISASDQEDPFALARTLSAEELDKLRLAEEFFERRHNRQKRSRKIAVASQALVGYVAFAGLIVNAYQSYVNAKKQERQQQSDQERWSKEFDRARQSDKYRAFFETSVLATDPTNADKRLVGYALLQEFVDDKDYNTKATLMLEESLMTELRNDKADKGLDEKNRNAVLAIVTALSQTSDCHALERAARSIDKIARRHAETGDIDETLEVFNVYLRRIVGRAAMICPTLKDFRAIRAPIRDTLIRIPTLGGLTGKISAAEANAKIAEMIRDRCKAESLVSGAGDCSEIFTHYVKLCTQASASELKEDIQSCQIMKDAAQEAQAQAQAAAAAAPPNPSP